MEPMKRVKNIQNHTQNDQTVKREPVATGIMEIDKHDVPVM